MASTNSKSTILNAERARESENPVFPAKIHRTTLARRAKGEIQPRKYYHPKWSLLSKEQEQLLVHHIDVLTKRGFPPNHHQIRCWVANITGKLPGKNWSYKFVRNHSDSITSKYLTGFDIQRRRADNYWVVNSYFQLVKEKVEQYKITPGNTYNMDEKGFLIGKVHKTKRVFSHSWKKQGKLQGAAQDGNRTWITVLATICADGTSLAPGLIYPASTGNLQDSWLEDFNPEDLCYFASTPAGWTNNELAIDWLIRVFDQNTRQKARYGCEPRLLLLDGHGSHINLPFLEECEKRNIHVCAYPPHSTHRLQPLDVSLFGPLAQYYSQALDSWFTETQGLCSMSKRQFYKLFKQAYEQAFTVANITSGWQKTGLQPLNPHIVLQSLSTQPKSNTASRPATSGSSNHSIISTSDWKKINTMLREAMGDILGYEERRVLKVCHQLQVQNKLLKAEIQGLHEAVRTEKAKKKRKKPLFANLRDNEGAGAIFFSPAKVQAARELQQQQEKEAEEVAALKEQQKIQRQQQKERQAIERAAAAAARRAAREQREQQAAQKKASQEEANIQRMASLQLANEQRRAAKVPRKVAPKPQHHAPLIDDEGIIYEVPKTPSPPPQMTRSGRQLRKPQRFND
jgi:hypothetical protein